MSPEVHLKRGKPQAYGRMVFRIRSFAVKILPTKNKTQKQHPFWSFDG